MRRLIKLLNLKLDSYEALVKRLPLHSKIIRERLAVK